MKTINVKKAYEEQTRLRLKLLENGWRPLPTAEKVAFQTAWPTRKVDAQAIRSWPLLISRPYEGGVRSVPAVTTAIQLQGDLLAIDVDVQDDDVSFQIEAMLRDTLGKAWAKAGIRDTGGSKFMVLLRSEEPFAIWRTSKFVDDEGRDHAVEIFGGAATRYFSCYGPHTLGALVEGEYEVVKEYGWDSGIEPAKLRPEDLPVVTLDQVKTVCKLASDILEGAGWRKQKGSFAGHSKGGLAYDLTEDMVFDCNDGETYDYHNALAYALLSRDARCSGSFLDGEPHENRTRCRLGVVGEGDDIELMVFDHESWVQHMPASHAPRSPEERSSRTRELGQSLAALDLDDFEGVDEEVVDDLMWMLENLIFCEATDAFHRAGKRADKPIKRSAITTVFNEKVTYWGWDRRTVPPTQVEKTTTVGKIFLAQPGIKKVAAVGFDPREPLYYGGKPGGLTAEYVNAYGGLPDLGPARGDLVMLLRESFLPHLVPDLQERQYLLDWLKVKVDQPWFRGAAILFLAPGVAGTGRGALFSMLNELFGDYGMKLNEQQLFEKHNGWADRSLLIMTDELGGGTWRDRQEDYQRLKEIVDPTNNWASVRRMREDSSLREVFTSFILATNRINAMAFDAEDRRIAVLTNSPLPLTQAGAWADKLMVTSRDDGWAPLAAALRQVLDEHVVTNEMRDLVVPPRFKGWHKIAAAGMSELDEVLMKLGQKYDVLKAWTVEDFRRTVRLELFGSTEPKRNDGVAAAISKLQEEAVAERFGLWNLGQIKHTDRDGRDTVITNDFLAFRALSLAERGEVLAGKSGPGNLAILARKQKLDPGA